MDVDTHYNEPHDLWTSRAPAKYADRVPRVVERDGALQWVFDDITLGHAATSSVIAADGSKMYGMSFVGHGIDEIHPGAYDIDARLEVMDEHGIWAQIVTASSPSIPSRRWSTSAPLGCASVSQREP